MFSGIVQGCKEVVGVTTIPGLVTLAIDLDEDLAVGLQIGASVAIDGVCLTATSLKGSVATFDAVEETQNVTTIGAVAEGRRVNVERSITSIDEIGGHQVSGHIHATAAIVDIAISENNQTNTFQITSEWMKYIFPKGFVALDGCSLTVVSVDRAASTFSVTLIPETLRMTTFGFKGEGDLVNVEIEQQTRVIVDTVERVLAERA